MIPNVKNQQFTDGFADCKAISWKFAAGTDERVSREAYRICKSTENGISASVSHKDGDSESYELTITPDEIKICSDSAQGAFYALQTLKQLLSENAEKVRCQQITDAPDMKYRGFYQDVTRGKIPTLETLKNLADTMACYKMNSLQLYVEHVFEFREYEFCREQLGYLTKEEIRELDRYCKTKFIDLVPSVSLFGHLYHLLSNEKYRHLSELPDYQPTRHYWLERMQHHTINPTLEESFSVIKSLIDQYLEVSTSDYFNICCDETFDLGTGANAGKDKGKLYFDFVKKIITYLRGKGKTVMMWGDIILQHPEYIEQLPDGVIFLNWGYDQNPDEEQYKKVAESGKEQILCPGTSSWNAFTEHVDVEEGNISALAAYGHKYHATGILNTNWGDWGNIASLSMAMYGMVLGAALAWSKETTADDTFRAEASQLLFGNRDMVAILKELSAIRYATDWEKVVDGHSDRVVSAEDYEKHLALCRDCLKKVKNLTFRDELVKREAISAIEGYEMMLSLCANADELTVSGKFDIPAWLEEYKALWLIRNKPSELDELVRVIKKWF